MNDQQSGDLTDLSCQPLCKACSGETRVLYVHLCSGTIVKVANSRRVRVTAGDIIIECGDGQAVEFRRADVYFTSCENCLPPISAE